MKGFTYENQGSETMLVYHLGEHEHLDHFAKGMLQGNEMAGVLRPSFMQRDLDQYLKFPVTSKIPLKEFLQNEMERTTMLKLCLSIAGAVQEVEEYMLTPEKLVLDQEYIFVDIRKKEAGLLYLPVDEFAQGITVKEFLLSLLSHTQYQLDKDVSYVAKLIHFLNQPKAWEFDALQRHIQNLLSPQDTEKVMMDLPHQEPEPVSLPEKEPMVIPSDPPRVVKTIDMPVPEGFNPIAEDLDTPKKKGLFRKKDKKEKVTKTNKKTVLDAAAIGGMPNHLPNMAIPGTNAVPDRIPEQPQWQGQTPEVVLNVDEEGKFLLDQSPVEKRKKTGLFSLGKNKKVQKAPLMPERQAMPPTPPTPPMPSTLPTPPTPPMQPMSSMQPMQPTPNYMPDREPVFHQNMKDSSVYMEHGSSDDKNMTVIMGGGKDYGSTVILGAGGERSVAAPHHVVKITRRRTGQSMVINKELFRIGSEGSFVDFFIGDNPAIGSCHADIFVDGGLYYITDRNSVNHTYVNGTMAPPMQAVQLGNGCVVTLADEDFDFIIS